MDSRSIQKHVRVTSSRNEGESQWDMIESGKTLRKEGYMLRDET